MRCSNEYAAWDLSQKILFDGIGGVKLDLEWGPRGITPVRLPRFVADLVLVKVVERFSAPTGAKYLQDTLRVLAG